MEKTKFFKGANFYPKGLSKSVPTSGTSEPLKIEKVRGKTPVVRAIYANDVDDVSITIAKSGAGNYVDNVPLSVFRSDRPIPVELPEGDYTIQYTSSASVAKIANLCFLIELL